MRTSLRVRDIWIVEDADSGLRNSSRMAYGNPSSEVITSPTELK